MKRVAAHCLGAHVPFLPHVSMFRSRQSCNPRDHSPVDGDATCLQSARSREAKLQANVNSQETTKTQVEAMLGLKQGQAKEAQYAVELQEVIAASFCHVICATIIKSDRL